MRQALYLKGAAAGQAVDAHQLQYQIVAYLPAYLVVAQPPQRIDRREKGVLGAARQLIG